MRLYCNNCCIKNGREGKDHEEECGPGLSSICGFRQQTQTLSPLPVKRVLW